MTLILRRVLVFLVVASLEVATQGCALKRIAINSVADSLSETGDTFAADDDPDLIRAAVPFSLKLVESLLAEVPNHRGLLLTACSSFTQYAYAFVDLDAEMLKIDDYTRYAKLQERARKMYLRGRDYCMRSLDRRYRGIAARLIRDPDKAVVVFQKSDVPLLYWTAASWGKAVALSLDRPQFAGDFPMVQAIARRALALDESYNEGAIHEVMITIESLPAAMGGSRDRAKHHYDRALALTQGHSAGPHLSYAMGVLLPQQKRAEFEGLLKKALAIDIDRQPRLRLANILAQQHAQYLLDHLDDLFLSDKEGGHGPR